ncbi:MAG: hypothetical protein IJ157_01870 [Clostridia bacterium]|nr:hypothetical protein [Clostridia bacterium]
MDFMQRIRAFFSKLTYGSYGSDQLGRAILYGSILLLFLSFALGVPLFWYLSIAGYIWAIYRIFSKNRAKRQAENALYLQKTEKLRTEVRQARVRFRNRKQFKYFKCPQCHTRMRLTRGCGEKNVCCPKCKNTFKMKA